MCAQLLSFFVDCLHIAPSATIPGPFSFMRQSKWGLVLNRRCETYAVCIVDRYDLANYYTRSGIMYLFSGYFLPLTGSLYQSINSTILDGLDVQDYLSAFWAACNIHTIVKNLRSTKYTLLLNGYSPHRDFMSLHYTYTVLCMYVLHFLTRTVCQYKVHPIINLGIDAWAMLPLQTSRFRLSARIHG